MMKMGKLLDLKKPIKEAAKEDEESNYMNASISSDEESQ
jgi:hypothetical protein